MPKPPSIHAALAAGFFAIGLAIHGAEKPTPAPSPWGEFVEADFPFFSSVVDARKLGDGLPADNLTPRALVLNLGHDCWVAFDTELLRVSAIWVGRGISPVSMAQGSYHVSGVKAQEGQSKLPQIAGSAWLASGAFPAWQSGETLSFADPREPGPDPKEVGRGPLPVALGRFKAVRLVDGGAQLEYTVRGSAVTERFEADMQDGTPVVRRHLRMGPATQPLRLVLGKTATKLNILVSGDADLEPTDEAAGMAVVRVPASAKAREFSVALSTASTLKGRPALPAKLPPVRWKGPVTTAAKLSPAKDAYVLDNIGLPETNPWKRNVRLADIAFLKSGTAAAVTFDGDVWMISGLSENLQKVTWRRFTSGLHEPLGITVRNDELFVFDRNGVWLLRDTDGNGEADVHELFSNAFTQTAETREFASGIRTAPDGSFVIAKGGQQSATVGRDNGSVLRIAADGATATTLGHGFRGPFIGVNPKTGLVTASDQQGHYVPTTPLHVLKGDAYHGFIPLILPKEKYPEPIADPLTWIPHPVNASGAGQAWLTGAKMGPLTDGLIHFGYYRPEIFLVRLSERAPQLQASVMSLTRQLEFPPLAGAVNPIDGQLYVIGFQIWGTTAKQISGLARLRYTGAPDTLPREIVPMDKGLLLRFDIAVDAASVTPGSFSVERWNYVRTANYGSPHFKLDGGKGQDPMPASSAYLSKDGRNVFVGLPDMRTVMQMRLGWLLKTAAGAAFEQSAYFTPKALTAFDPEKEGFGTIAVDLTPRAAIAAANTPVTIDEGRRVSELMGCVACHSNDGSLVGKVGPSWKGLFGSQRQIVGGSKVVADEAYLRESIKEPAAKVLSGFEKNDTGMPSYEGIATEAQIEALILYIKSLK